MMEIDNDKLMEEMMRGVTCSPWVMDDEIVVKKAEWQALIDKIARLENELHGKGNEDTFKTAEWK